MKKDESVKFDNNSPKLFKKRIKKSTVALILFLSGLAISLISFVLVSLLQYFEMNLLTIENICTAINGVSLLLIFVSVFLWTMSGSKFSADDFKEWKT